MFQIGIEVRGEPDFYPDHLDVPALPPQGTVVNIDGRRFTVEQLRLEVTVRPHDGGGQVIRAHYEADIERS